MLDTNCDGGEEALYRLTLRDLTFGVAFNKIMRASEAGQVSKPGLEDLSKRTAL